MRTQIKYSKLGRNRGRVRNKTKNVTFKIIKPSDTTEHKQNKNLSIIERRKTRHSQNPRKKKQ